MIYQKVANNHKTYSDLALDPQDSDDGLVRGEDAIKQAVRTLSGIEKRSFFNEPWLGVRIKTLLHRPMSSLVADELVLNSVLDINDQEPRTHFQLGDTVSEVHMRKRIYKIFLVSEIEVSLDFIK